MALRDLSDSQAVVAALDEFDALGREPFLAKYGFGKAQYYMLRRDGKLYDSKAIAAAAHGHQFGRPLHPYAFSGGLAQAVRQLNELGFEIIDTRTSVESPVAVEPPQLTAGRIYSWEDLADLFGFEPGWLNRMGGMGSLPKHSAVLIITHPGGGKSFDYDDYWDGADLIYTGKGQDGDQKRTGENRYVGDNLRTLLLFEQAGPAQLRYVGSPVCIDEWPETAFDREQRPRQVIRFRLRINDSQPTETRSRNEATAVSSADPQRRPRPFDPRRAPKSRSSDGSQRRDPAETAALQEKAMQGHHGLVATVNAALLAAGWTDVGEIPAAIDLWGRDPDGVRTIFEMKTMGPNSELERVRAAIAQLLEYRFFYGAPDDRLCLVSGHPLSDKRVRLLRELGIAVIVVDDGTLVAGSPDARERLMGIL